MKTNPKPARCHKCIRRSAYKLVDKWYCRKCFSGLVEQKIRQNLRRYGIKKDSRLLVTDKASEHVVKKIIHLPVQIVKGKHKADYIVLPLTMDDENEEFLLLLFRNKKIIAKENRINSPCGERVRGNLEQIIKLFYPVSKKDMKAYFSIKKIAYKPEKSEINAMLDMFEKKYAGTKTSLLKSEERLKQIL